MNISAFCSNGNVFINCECIKGYAFKNAAFLVKSAFCLLFAPFLGFHGITVSIFAVLNASCHT